MFSLNKKILICSFFIGISSFLIVSRLYSQSYVKTKIVLFEGGNSISRSVISNALTNIMQETNRATSKGEYNFYRIKKFFTENGFEEFNQIYRNFRFYSVLPQLKLNLLERPNGDFIVRGIKVWAFEKGYKEKRSEYLVFNIESTGLISHVKFSLEQHAYEKLIQCGSDSLDKSKRETIISFLEEYRTAYDKKDILFIEKVFSDDAIIIVGDTTADVKKSLEVHHRTSFNWKKRLAYSDKKEYIEKLRYIFKRNSFISVEFNDIQIVRHPKDSNFYGVNFEQRWKSSQYSDIGYVFLLFEFFDDFKPIILVRFWQNYKFEDGTVINLSDFDIIK